MVTKIPKTRIGLGVLLILNFLAWLAQDWLTAEIPLLTDVTFLGPLFLSSTCVALGMAIADYTNPRSWLKVLEKERNRVCVVEQLVIATVMEPKSLEVWLTLRFIKDVPSAIVSARIFGLIRKGQKPQISVLKIDELEMISKDETHRYVIARRPISFPGWEPIHDLFFPEISNTSISFVSGSRNLVELEIKFGRSKQVERIYVEYLSTGSAEYPPGVFVTHEDNDLFQV